MDDSAGMMRAMQLYNIVKMGIPGITQQQLVDFMMAQSAERQAWFKTASLMDMADWVVEEMREQNYPASAAAMDDGEAQALALFYRVKAKVPGITQQELLDFAMAQSPERQYWFKTASMTEIVNWVAANYPNAGEAKKVEEPGMEICSECGEKMPPGSITCPNCGNTKWGCLLGIIIFIVIMIAAVVDLVNNQHIFWAVVVSVLPLGAVIALISFLVDAFKHS